MSKRKFNREASLEAEEVILDLAVENPDSAIDTANVSVEIMKTLDPTEIPKEPVNVETKVSAVSEPTRAEIQLAQQLTGSPQVFDGVLEATLQSLARYGIAASFADEGYARGHRWHQFCK